MINRVILVGRITKEPELRTTASGINVLSFTLAFDNKNKNADGTRGSSFINCTAWRNNADIIAKYCHKGSQIGIDGSLQERKYQRRDGTNASVIEVVVNEIALLGSKSSSSTYNSQPEPASQGYVADEEPVDDVMAGGDGDLADDDLPF